MKNKDAILGLITVIVIVILGSLFVQNVWNQLAHEMFNLAEMDFAQGAAGFTLLIALWVFIKTLKGGE